VNNLPEKEVAKGNLTKKKKSAVKEEGNKNAKSKEKK
jgi:hypothetical protein